MKEQLGRFLKMERKNLSNELRIMQSDSDCLLINVLKSLAIASNEALKLNVKINAIHTSNDKKFCFIEFTKEQSKINHLLSRDDFIKRYGYETIKRFENVSM